MKPIQLKLDRKTGFRVTNTQVPILILDERGILFYDTSHLANRVREFNLPAGQYTVVRGRFTQRQQPVEYEKLPMPPPVRDKRKNPEKFKIVVADNPFKCTVDWKDELIIYDRELCDRPLPQLIWIYYHECGHRYYGVTHKPRGIMTPEQKREYEFMEMCCDRYAENQMLEAGYNPSQIGEAVIGTNLKSEKRTEAVVSSLVGDDYDHYEADNCECDNLTFLDTPSKDWTCEDWVVWHRDLLRAYQDGTIGKLSKEDALAETNRVFAYWWREAAGFSKKVWGECGWKSGFYNYFRSVGYTDHIGFVQAIITTAADAATNVTTGAGDIVTGTGNLGKFLGDNLIFIVMGIIILFLFIKLK